MLPKLHPTRALDTMAKRLIATSVRGRTRVRARKIGGLKMKLRLAPLVFTFVVMIFAVNPALAQSGADAPKTPGQHQPGVAGKPAPAAQADAPNAARTQSSDPATKLDPAKDAAIRHLMDITEVSNMGQNIQNYITEQVRSEEHTSELQSHVNI